MSGHSKWAITKHKKAAIDAKRGKLFARLIKNTEVAVRIGSDDSVGNPTLFDVIQRVKKNSVPTGNITHATKRGSRAEAGGANYETTMYEGYGPDGAAFYIERFTDNRNRAASDVHLVFTRSDGSMADPGSVVFLFSRRDIAEVTTDEGVDEDSIVEAVPEAGAEEVGDLEDGFVVESDPSDVVEIRKALQATDIDCDSAEVQFVAVTGVELDLEGAMKVQRLVGALEDPDDVQNIYHNMTVSDEIRAQLEEEE